MNLFGVIESSASFFGLDFYWDRLDTCVFFLEFCEENPLKIDILKQAEKGAKGG